MKRKLLFAAVALLCAVGTWATDWTGNAVAAGEFYLYNVGADRYLSFGENWSSIATADHAGIPVTLTVSNGNYTITTNVTGNGKGLFMADDMAYTDGTPGEWTFTDANVAGKYVYTLKSGDNYLYWSGTEASQVLSKASDISGVAAANTQWQLVKKAERDAAFEAKNATESTPLDITYKYIENPNTTWFTNIFSTNNPWTKGGIKGYDIKDGNSGWWDGKDKTYEVYNGEFDNYIEITNVPNGIYEFGVQGFYRDGTYSNAISHYHAGTFVENAKIYANSNTTSLQSIGKSEQTSQIYNGNDKSADVSGTTYYVPDSPLGGSLYFIRGKYPWQFVRTVVTNNTLRFGVKKEATIAGDWTLVDKFYLSYLGIDLSALKGAMDAAVVTAEAIDQEGIPTTIKAALNSAISTHKNQTYTTEEAYNNAISELNTAIDNANNSKTPNANFLTLKSKAQAIADVAYTEKVDDSHATFATAISTQQTVVDNATTIDAINTAISTLTAAIKTYINGAEPLNDGEFFDITCLMANPDFDENTITGWTKESTLNPNTRIQCNEFYGKAAFDFYQIVEGLPNGSYTLSMKAFQRPGGYDAVYADWANKVNKTTAQVYVNNDASTVMNIMQEMNDTRIYTDPQGEDAFNSDKQPNNATGFIPNSMEGASAWFTAGKYQKTVAAVVESGSLRLGFKDAAHDSDVWTLFDEFRLCYYGSSKLIYYQQYLPQLRTEVSADLSNGAYENVLVSSEDEALDAALNANPAFETEEAYETVINNLKAAQAAFQAAAPSYDAMVAAKAYDAITKVSENIGDGVFQYNETTNNNLFNAYETAKSAVDNYTQSTSSTAAGAQALVDALDEAISNYNYQALNAPDANKRYWVTIEEDGKAWNGNAITFIAGGREGMGNYGIKYLTPANANMNQALKFTAVEGEANTYKVSAINAETGAEQYLTTGNVYTDVEGNSVKQLRTTDDASKAVWVRINANTATAGQFQLLNGSDNNTVIANNNNNDMYTANSCNFTIAEASQASVPVSAKAGKYGTVIFPFTPDVTSGFDDITFYGCEEVNNTTNNVLLVEATELAANTPYLIKNNGGSDFSKVLTGWGTAAATSYKVGLLTGVYTAATIDANANNYVLQTQGDVQAFYSVDADFTATANKAYLTYDASATVKAFGFEFNDATGIEAIDEAVNGKSSNGKWYNLAGQRVNKAQKGIYIVNGKKIAVK